jgi:hypothetical protein
VEPEPEHARLGLLGGHVPAGESKARRGEDLGVTFGVHSVRRQPPGEGRTFVTYAVRVGSSLPDDGRNRTLLEAGRPSTLVIPVEISINEPIGAHNSLALSGGRPLRVSTLEDIVAEKLRAYL